MKAKETRWIATFIKNVKPYIFVRLEDNLLIKRPNTAVKLNPTGALILHALLDGMPLQSVFRKTGAHGDAQKQGEIVNFLFAVKHQLEGKLDEFSLNPAVETETFGLNFSKLPVLSEIAVTYRCNLKCRFCYAGCNCTVNPVRSNDEMSLRQVKTVLRKIYHQAKVPTVSFTGGEPTLVPELPRMIRYAKGLGMRVNLITNGTAVTPGMARTLARAGLDSAQVSLEGVSAATHDTIVQSSGAFVKTTAAVRYLKDAGIHTHTNTTLSQHNMAESSRLPSFIKNQLGNDRFSMNLVIPSGSGSINDDLVVKYSETGPLLEAILLSSREEGVEFMWYSPVPLCMFNPIIHGLGNKGCSACDGLLSVAPNGDVLPCSSYPGSVGNLLREDAADIWQSPKARDFRAKTFAHPGCKQCVHFAACNGACPLYWQHMGFGELKPYLNGTIDGCAIEIENPMEGEIQNGKTIA